jgi:hypothetical protein
MLKHARTFVVWCCVAWVLALVAWGATYSPSYRKCVGSYANNKGADERSDLNETVASSPRIYILPAFLLCEGAFIDENSGTITAFATLAIAGFTLTLWRATNSLWDAGERQLRAMRQSVFVNIAAAKAAKKAANVADRMFVDLERPWVFINLHTGFSFNRDDGSVNPLVRYEIVNHGRTPAMIEQCWIGPVTSDAEPEIPVEELRWNGPIGADKKITDCQIPLPAGFVYDRLIDVETIEGSSSAPEAEGELFFYAIVSYRDMTRESHRSVFCWRWDRAGFHWMRYGANNPQYDYMT